MIDEDNDQDSAFKVSRGFFDIALSLSLVGSGDVQGQKGTKSAGAARSREYCPNPHPILA